jgi:hypothetical protein
MLKAVRVKSEQCLGFNQALKETEGATLILNSEGTKGNRGRREVQKGMEGGGGQNRGRRGYKLEWEVQN